LHEKLTTETGFHGEVEEKSLPQQVAELEISADSLNKTTFVRLEGNSI
jgi:hypothetical protein